MKYCLSALPEIDRRLEETRRVLIATDFDGTLCPIAQSPSEVRLAPAMLEILRHAAGCQRLTLAVISGRALEDVRRRLPLDVLFAGNHGLEIAGGGLSFAHDGARQLRSSLTNACDALVDVLRRWPSAFVEDKGLSATLHFRRVDHRHHNSLVFAARRAVSVFGRDLALRVGRLALEIRPKVQWDKGSALQYILEKAGPFEACVCLGDDRTDESMYRANGSQLNIRVGCLRATAATHYLLDSTEVAIFLSHIADVCGSETRGLRVSDYAASTAAV